MEDKYDVEAVEIKLCKRMNGITSNLSNLKNWVNRGGVYNGTSRFDIDVENFVLEFEKWVKDARKHLGESEKNFVRNVKIINDSRALLEDGKIKVFSNDFDLDRRSLHDRCLKLSKDIDRSVTVISDTSEFEVHPYNSFMNK